MENQWNDIIKQIFGKETRLIFPKFFYSKKNQVTLLDLENNDGQFAVVAKYYVWGDIEKERYILQKAAAKGLRTPSIIAQHDNILFVEHIPGITIRAILSSGGEFPSEVTAQWLAQFHRAFSCDGATIIKGDVMPPNFIVHKDSGLVYGIDFEEAMEGAEIEDIADIAATIKLIGSGTTKDRNRLTASFLQTYLEHNPINVDYSQLIDLTVAAFKRRYKFMPEMSGFIDECISNIEKEGKDFFHAF